MPFPAQVRQIDVSKQEAVRAKHRNLDALSAVAAPPGDGRPARQTGLQEVRIPDSPGQSRGDLQPCDISEALHFRRVYAPAAAAFRGWVECAILWPRCGP
jgi:hypothetical protein